MFAKFHLSMQIDFFHIKILVSKYIFDWNVVQSYSNKTYGRLCLLCHHFVKNEPKYNNPTITLTKEIFGWLTKKLTKSLNEAFSTDIFCSLVILEYYKLREASYKIFLFKKYCLTLIIHHHASSYTYRRGSRCLWYQFTPNLNYSGNNFK